MTRHQAKAGFTLVEGLVALLILSIGLSVGLGAIVRGRVALEVVALQARLDQSLDQLHEAVRSRTLDVEALAERESAYIEPFTFRLSALPPEDAGQSGTPSLSAEVTPTDLPDLFRITLTATGSRGRIQRARPLTTLFFQPGLTSRLESRE